MDILYEIYNDEIIKILKSEITLLLNKILIKYKIIVILIIQIIHLYCVIWTYKYLDRCKHKLFIACINVYSILCCTCTLLGQNLASSFHR